MLPWSANSPDLSPIENMWSIVGTTTDPPRDNQRPRRMEFASRIKATLAEMPQTDIQNCLPLEASSCSSGYCRQWWGCTELIPPCSVRHIGPQEARNFLTSASEYFFPPAAPRLKRFHLRLSPAAAGAPWKKKGSFERVLDGGCVFASPLDTSAAARNERPPLVSVKHYTTSLRGCFWDAVNDGRTYPSPFYSRSDGPTTNMPRPVLRWPISGASCKIFGPPLLAGGGGFCNCHRETILQSRSCPGSMFEGVIRGRGVVVVRLLVSHQDEPGSISDGAAPGFSHVGRCRCSAGFLGDFPFRPPLRSGAAPYSPRFTLIGSRYLDVESRPNIFTHSLSHSYELLRQRNDKCLVRKRKQPSYPFRTPAPEIRVMLHSAFTLRSSDVVTPQKNFSFSFSTWPRPCNLRYRIHVEISIRGRTNRKSPRHICSNPTRWRRLRHSRPPSCITTAGTGKIAESRVNKQEPPFSQKGRGFTSMQQLIEKRRWLRKLNPLLDESGELCSVDPLRKRCEPVKEAMKSGDEPASLLQTLPGGGRGRSNLPRPRAPLSPPPAHSLFFWDTCTPPRLYRSFDLRNARPGIVRRPSVLPVGGLTWLTSNTDRRGHSDSFIMVRLHLVHDAVGWRLDACRRTARPPSLGVLLAQCHDDKHPVRSVSSRNICHTRPAWPAVNLLAFHQGKPGSIPGRATPGHSHAGIVLDDAACRRVFSGISRFPRLFIPTLLHTHLNHPLL
ncbi:hypothetical protein PR048_027548 [Dryococelus australis]|uniref:Uncharacterized protein n=1 Tax=Dryococelus australis TaxID=614101 RepID=A0ABQ9GGU2_9NEOP|nr:hypothetical protein PR048_027548 [Dryococelus australis]